MKNKKKQIGFLALLCLSLAVCSCSINKSISKIPPVQRHEIINGGGYDQRGYGKSDSGDTIRLFGEVRYYDNSRASNADIYLITHEQDTVAKIRADLDGRFDTTIKADIFCGQLIPSGGACELTIPNLSLGVYSCVFRFMIRLPLLPSIDYDYIIPNRKDRREINRRMKKLRRDKLKREKLSN